MWYVQIEHHFCTCICWRTHASCQWQCSLWYKKSNCCGRRSSLEMLCQVLWFKGGFDYGNLGFVPSPPQKFSYDLYRSCRMRPPFRLLLTKSRYPERAARATGRIFFLTELESDISTSMFWFPHTELDFLFIFCAPWGQPCFVSSARRHRSNFSDKYQAQVVSIWSGPKSHYKSEIWVIMVKSQKKKAPQRISTPKLVCCCSSR